MQAATHCSRTFGLYDGNESLAHLFVDPVTSPSGEPEAKPMVTTTITLYVSSLLT
jgi:hypothetical protein